MSTSLITIPRALPTTRRLAPACYGMALTAAKYTRMPHSVHACYHDKAGYRAATKPFVQGRAAPASSTPQVLHQSFSEGREGTAVQQARSFTRMFDSKALAVPTKPYKRTKVAAALAQKRLHHTASTSSHHCPVCSKPADTGPPTAAQDDGMTLGQFLIQWTLYMTIAMATFIVVAIFIECVAAIRNHLLEGGGSEAYWPNTEKDRQERFEKKLTELVAQLQTGKEGQAS